MKLLELPLDVFRKIIDVVVHELGLKESMRARRVCHVFASSIPEALYRTRIIEEAYEYNMFLVKYHSEVFIRYLLYRIQTDQSRDHPLIQTIHQTVQMLAQYAGWKQDQEMEMLYQASCSCLTLYKSKGVFWALKDGTIHMMPYEGGIAANCLTIAAWIGDMTLVKRIGLEHGAQSFFGRPLWAAAAQGHVDVVKLLLDSDILAKMPHADPHNPLEVAPSPLDVAAYIGRESVVQLFLSPQYYNATVQYWEASAIKSAAKGGHSNILTLLIHHSKEVNHPNSIMQTLCVGLLTSCRHGMHQTAQIFLEHGVEPVYTDAAPRSCLQLAAITGNAELVTMLLDAGASLEPAPERYLYDGRRFPCKIVWKDALSEAHDRGHKEVERVISERMAGP